MTGWAERVRVARPVRAVLATGLVALTGLTGLVTGAGPAQAQRVVPHTELFAFDDEDIFESSGLVDRGRTVYTVNDSGDDAVVYGVDATTGRTVSRTTYAEDATDVEALAPGQDGTLWAGDIGDNARRRDELAVHRLRPVDGTTEARHYRLAYPDGAHDAEALLVRPRTGRVFVVTKSPFGATVYAAPTNLRTDRVNRLAPYARTAGLVTDGTFFPGGRRVLLRTYGSATVYTFPGFEPVGSVRLPSQPQGEGISVSATGRVLVSSEGVRAPVLQVRLPSSLTDPPPAPAASAGPPEPPPLQPESQPGEPRDGTDWLVIGVGAAGVAGLGWLVLRATRLGGSRR